MTNIRSDELEWLAAQQPQTIQTDRGAHDRLLLALSEHVSQDRAGRRRAPRRRPRVRRFALPAIAGIATVAAVGAVIAVDHTPTSARNTLRTAIVVPQVRHRVSGDSALIRLAADVTASPTPSGNATLVARTNVGGGFTDYSLFTDDGQYYFSHKLSGLPAQVSAHNDQADGLFAREVAAAKLGASGDVETAGQALADAGDPGHVTRPVTTQPETAAIVAKLKATGQPAGKVGELMGTGYDNAVWENSEDALVAGAGDPQVRAGVLRILATLPGVTVTDTTTDGIPSLTLSASTYELVTRGYIEQMTINAANGEPMRFYGGPPSGAGGASLTYGVSRVDTANLAVDLGSHRH